MAKGAFLLLPLLDAVFAIHVLTRNALIGVVDEALANDAFEVFRAFML